MARLADVIAAISTPLGKGGVSVIRMSGVGALEIADKIFLPMSGKLFSEHPARMQVYGNIVSGGERLDDALACYFEMGKSYTGEDTVELSCHGSILVTRCVLEALFTAGARPAEAGEFTRRAFINGRLSLTDAEAIGSLLEAKSREQIRLAGGDARAKLDGKISEIRGELVTLLSSSYARIDYPDEDLGDFTDGEYLERLEAVEAELSELISTYRTGKAVNDGIATVICGKPNVGKSTLYNLLADEELAIVTDISGTTTDVLERSLPLGRVMLNIADTAGIRSENIKDEIERIGISRSLKKIGEAELIFCVFDQSRAFEPEDEKIISEIQSSSACKIAILNKSDAVCPEFDSSKLTGFCEVIELSAKCREADSIAKLTVAVEKLFTDEKIVIGTDAVVSTARQNAKLNSALELIKTAKDAMAMGIPQDAVSSDVERALAVLGEVDGRAVGDEVIGDIFSKFCVGK